MSSSEDNPKSEEEFGRKSLQRLLIANYVYIEINSLALISIVKDPVGVIIAE